MGVGPPARAFMDSRLLGLGQRRLLLACGILGTACGFLRRGLVGFGYTGVGFFGGVWSGGVFTYNSAVTNIGTSVSITNVYNKTVINNNTTNVSYNGGAGGIHSRPTLMNSRLPMNITLGRLASSFNILS